MHRVLFSHPHIGSYSALLFLALVAGWWVARRSARLVGIEPRHIDNLSLLVALSSLFGARFFSWLFYFPSGYSFWTAMTMGGGGMVFYGGFIFGIAAVVLYAALQRLSLRALFDVFAAPVALGLSLGRVGCFMAGCCWGDICGPLPPLDSALQRQVQTVPWLSPAKFPLAVRFPPGAGAYEQHHALHLIEANAGRSLPVHPVQLYEATLAALLAWHLHRKLKNGAMRGVTTGTLVLGYAAIRFITEIFRADNPAVLLGMTLSQVISIALVLIYAGWWYALNKHRSAQAAAADRFVTSA